MAPPFLVVVTGLLAEARVAAQAGRTIAAGGDATRLEAELERALSAGAAAVLSFGLAAGLQPGRAAGTVVIPDEVIGAGARYATDAEWSRRLRMALGEAEARPLAGVDAPLIRPADKLQLHLTTGAVAADMESHVAARIARKAGRPFAVLRAIADPSERIVPPAAVIGMKPGGRIAVGAVIGSLVRNPGQLDDLARIASDVLAALKALGRCRRAVGPQLGWPAPGSL